MKRLLVALALAGCASVGDRMQPYVGQSITALTARIGPPQGDSRVGGQRWYTWSSDRLVQGMTTQINAQCRLSVRVDATDHIVGGRWEGDALGCDTFARALR